MACDAQMTHEIAAQPVASANAGSALHFQSSALGPAWLRLSLDGLPSNAADEP